MYNQFRPVGAYNNDGILAAIFASDYQDGDWETQNEAALQGLSFLAPERGLMVSRSDYSTNGLALQFHCRQDLGGHTYGDRNNFTLSGLGRMWVHYTFGPGFVYTKYMSGILVDDLGMPVTLKHGTKVRQPGTILDYDEEALATWVAGDATYAYSWEWHWEAQPSGVDHSLLGTDGWVKVLETWNDFRYLPGTESYHEIPFYDYADWQEPGKFERMIKRPYNPMQRVYRTAGLVRGSKPYALIVDDIQKDGSSHNYKWLAQIPDDLSVASTDVNLDPADYRADVILAEPGGTGNRRLLVRVLNNEGFSGGAPGYVDQIDLEINTLYHARRLVVESDSVAPDFKVLLYPHRVGDALPVTRWNPAHTQVTVDFGDQVDVLTFTPGPDQRTRVGVQRISDPPQVVPVVQVEREGGVKITWDADVGHYYQVDTSSNLAAWSALVSNYPPDGAASSSTSYTDPAAAAGAGFYRVTAP